MIFVIIVSKLTKTARSDEEVREAYSDSLLVSKIKSVLFDHLECASEAGDDGSKRRGLECTNMSSRERELGVYLTYLGMLELTKQKFGQILLLVRRNGTISSFCVIWDRHRSVSHSHYFERGSLFSVHYFSPPAADCPTAAHLITIK